MATTNVINLTPPFSVPHGGTGNTTLTTPYGVLTAGTTATGPVQTASTGLAGQLFTSSGTGTIGAFSNSPGKLLASVVATNVATVDFTNVFSNKYEVYFLAFENYLPSSDGTDFTALFGIGATPTYQNTGYFGNSYQFGSLGSTSSSTSLLFFQSQSNVANFEANGYFFIFNVNNSPSAISVTGIMNSWISGVLSNNSVLISCGWKGSLPATSLRFLSSSGNIATGRFYLYGLSL